MFILIITMQYSQKVIDHCDNPVNVGSFNRDDIDVGTGIVGSAACGDVIKIQIRIRDGIIIDTRFKAFGCSSAIAASSWTAGWLLGKTIDEAITIENKIIADDLSLSKIKLHCSVLAKEAIEAAIQDYFSKNP